MHETQEDALLGTRWATPDPLSPHYASKKAAGLEPGPSLLPHSLISLGDQVHLGVAHMDALRRPGRIDKLAADMRP